MTDLPKRVEIQEEGPREGFQIEPGPIATADKIRFIEALAQTGLPKVQCVSFVNPRRVPGMADAEEVANSIRRKPGVQYTGLWLNLKGRILMSASETFSIRNSNKNTAETIDEQRRWLAAYRDAGIAVEWGSVMTAFGCNFEGAVPPSRVVETVATIMDLADEAGVTLKGVSFADTVGWATPVAVVRVIGAVRERWPDLETALHLHDTRGAGLANAYAGLRLGVTRFDSSCAGLGGCPFAGHKGAAGNICTEDLVFLCEEMGIETGVDLDALIDCAHMAEAIVGHPLPGKLMRGGSLSAIRARTANA